MKICHITSAHNRYDARIFKRECISLAKEPSNEVVLVCCDGKPYEIKEGIQIVSYTSTKLSKKERFRLLFSNKALVNYLLTINADVYQFHDIELIEVGRKLSKKGKCVVFDSHENWPGYIAELVAKPYSCCYEFVVQLIEFYYRRILHNFSAIYSVSPNMVNDLQRLTSTPVFFVPNYPFSHDITPMLFQDKKNKFIYQGTVYGISNQETIVNALQKIDDEVSYNVVGLVSEQLKSKMQQLDRRKSVEFTSWVSPIELEQIMNECLAGIVVLDYSPVCCGKEGQLGSNKIFEYMKMGLPVICTDFDLWQSMIISKYKCGIAIPPQDEDRMIEAINFFLSHKEEAFEMGKRGQQAVVKEFCWELFEQEFVVRYNTITNNGK